MPSNAARPSRASETYARNHYDNAQNGGPSKKPRFDPRNPSALAPDAPEEDVVLEADVIGTRGQRVKRNAVNMDGYDSDSDEGNFDVRARKKAKEDVAANKVEDEDDMFAGENPRDGDDSEGDGGARGGKKKKEVRFIREDEIEGQDLDSRGGGTIGNINLNGRGQAMAEEKFEDDGSESDDERRDDLEDIDPELGAGSKKKHVPKLEAFNFKGEAEEGEGKFDEHGNFVRSTADGDDEHDLWLEGVASKKQIKQTAEAAAEREAQRRKRALEDDAQSTGEVLAKLIPMLETSETVLEALQRLGKSKKQKPKWHQKNRNKKTNGIEQDTLMSEDDLVEQKRLQDVETITAAADLLLTRGQPEIYDAERELLMRQYRKETGETWEDSAEQKHDDGGEEEQSDMTWEYRWADLRDGGVIHGPYDGGTMKAWNEAGYFGEGVEFRQCHSKKAWSQVPIFA